MHPTRGESQNQVARLDILANVDSIEFYMADGGTAAGTGKAAKGPIAAINEGDIIEIDIPNNKLNVKLSDDEIRQRLADLPEFEPKIKSGYLARYATMVSSADKGAVFPR